MRHQRRLRVLAGRVGHARTTGPAAWPGFVHDDTGRGVRLVIALLALLVLGLALAAPPAAAAHADSPPRSDQPTAHTAGPATPATTHPAPATTGGETP